MKFAYIPHLRLNTANRARLQLVNSIIEEYRRQGYTLTLRQLYYQLVSKDIIANKLSEYSKLSTLPTQGRMAGIVDWDAIEDRVRKPHILASWDNPGEILQVAAEQFRMDRMKGQGVYLEMWVEKDALSEILKKSTNRYGVPVMVNRGYSSTTAMHDAFERMKDHILAERKVVILYLGDHDPSGMDMVRDIKDRLKEFFIGYQRTSAIENEMNEQDATALGQENGCWALQFDEHCDIQRIGLNMPQIRQYRPPPNPAKVTDPRAKAYIEEFGITSWEVDALKPEILHALVQSAVKEHLDESQYQAMLKEEKQHKIKLKTLIKSLEDDA